MQTVNVYKRLTHHYVDECRHLDKEEFVTTVKLTPRVQVREGNHYDDLGAYVQFARMPKGAGKGLLQGLADTLTNWGCTHDWDCCGCLLTSATVEKVGPRKLMVKISVGRNY